ncbi:NAD(P)-dependent oxidoreductase [Plantactinospora sonchi]|uniref:NAD(P)H-binding protein n=1 Tax=Plantactinospora sonchi TaxID=1544735 RepID=A0ABU7S3J1_9ACTN
MSRIVVFGAGGRAGRAVTAEARERGYRVTAVVRDTDRHADLVSPGVVLRSGDVRDAETVYDNADGHDAVVCAVTPASGPEEFANLDRFDQAYFVDVVDALLTGMTRAGVPRLVFVGLFANLLDGRGRPVYDNPDVFPPELRPYALAHTAGLDRLRAARTGVDWLVLTPPALLDPTGPRTGRYRFGGETAAGPATLSYADLAVAVLDEIGSPTRHRTRVSVHD